MPPQAETATESNRTTSPVQLQRFEQTWPAMGVELKITAYCENPQLANAAFAAARNRVESLEQILSNYRSNSEAVLLSSQAHAGPVPASKDLLEVLNRAIAISKMSGGAFDVTLAPLTDLWREARANRALPDESRIANAQQKTGFQYVQLEAEGGVRFERELRLDFGGIGKGYAADEALKILRQHGIDQAMVELGGDLAIGDPPPGTNGWRIAIAKIAAKPTHFVRLKNCGVATSGDGTQFVEIDGRRYSHIVDPKTGLGLQRRTSITVVADDATAADGLASACSVLDQSAAIQLANRTRGLHLYGSEWVDQKVVEFQSNQFPELWEISQAKRFGK